MMSERIYSFDAVFSAMCIMEEIASPTMVNRPWEDLRSDFGVTQLRVWIIKDLAEACDDAWDRSFERYQVEYGIWNQRRLEHEVACEPFFDDAPDDTGSFDYEFVPFWLRECVDWSSNAGPRVRGSVHT